MTYSVVKYLQTLIKLRPGRYLTEWQDRLYADLGIYVSISSISRHLRLRGNVSKKLQVIRWSVVSSLSFKCLVPQHVSREAFSERGLRRRNLFLMHRRGWLKDGITCLDEFGRWAHGRITSFRMPA